MNETMSGTDPWSPVDESRTTVNEVQPDAPLEVHGGEVTAHINLGGDTTPAGEKPAEEEPTEEEKLAADKAAADDADTEGDETAAEVEAAEQTLAEKLAALDAAKSGKKTAAKK